VSPRICSCSVHNRVIYTFQYVILFWGVGRRSLVNDSFLIEVIELRFIFAAIVHANMLDLLSDLPFYLSLVFIELLERFRGRFVFEWKYCGHSGSFIVESFIVIGSAY
jgi:hypothetical protein